MKMNQRMHGNTQEKSGSRRKILLKFYDGGMKSLREKKLIDKAVKLAGCSKLQVKNFIYNENKKRKMTTDVKFLNKTVTRNKFQAFQSKLARDVKIYGSKYNNKSASELWDSISKNHKPEVVQKTVKAHKVVESNERKLEALITEISKVNVNVMYARKSGKSTFCICSPLVKDMMEKFVTHVDKIFDRAFLILKYIQPHLTEDRIIEILMGKDPVRNTTVKNLHPDKDLQKVVIKMMDTGIITGIAKKKLTWLLNKQLC